MTSRPRKIAVTIVVASLFAAILITSASSAENIMQQLAAVQARERAMQLAAESAARAARSAPQLAVMAAQHVARQIPIVDHAPIVNVVPMVGPGAGERGSIDKGGPGRGGR